MTEAAVAFAVLIVAALGYHFFVAPSYSLLRKRSPKQERWSRLYTQSELPIVMRDLQTIRDAFLLRDADIYRLLPSDRLSRFIERLTLTVVRTQWSSKSFT